MSITLNIMPIIIILITASILIALIIYIFYL